MRTLFSRLPQQWLLAGLGLLLGACSHPTEQSHQAATTGATTDIPAACRPPGPFTTSLYQVNVRPYMTASMAFWVPAHGWRVLVARY